MTSMTLALTFIKILTSWTLFFLNSQQESRFLRTIICSIFCLLTIYLTSLPYIFITPFVMLVYKVIYYRNENLAQRIYYALMPIILTSLIAELIGFFILPFMTQKNPYHIWGDPQVEIMSYLGVIPTLTYLERILTIKNYSFNHYYLRTISKFLWVTNAFLIIYFFVLVYKNFQLEKNITLFWFSKSFALTCFFIFLYLASFLNHYSRKRARRHILEAERQHLFMIESYNQYVEDLYKDIRSFRHDYDNIMLSFAVSIEREDLEVIRQVYHEIMEKLEMAASHNVSLDTKPFRNLQNKQLELFLAFKFLEFQNKGIKANFVCLKPIDHFRLKTMDIIVLLSVNFEFVRQLVVTSKQKEITVVFEIDDVGNHILSVENSINQNNLTYNDQIQVYFEKTDVVIDVFGEKYPNLYFKREQLPLSYRQVLIISPESIINKEK